MTENVIMLINDIFFKWHYELFSKNEFKINKYNLGCPLWIIMNVTHITNLAWDELIMIIMQNLFIHKFIHLKHKYHVLKTHLTHK